MLSCGATLNENDSPLAKGAALSFRLLSPFGKGDFWRSFSCRVAPPRSMKTIPL